MLRNMNLRKSLHDEKKHSRKITFEIKCILEIRSAL